MIASIQLKKSVLHCVQQVLIMGMTKYITGRTGLTGAVVDITDH